MNILKYTKEIVGGLIIVLALFFIIAGFTDSDVASNIEQEEVPQEQDTAPTDNPAYYFRGLDLEARAAYVFDVKESTTIFAKNAETSLPIASLTKLVTALTAVESVPDESTPVTIGIDALIQDGDNGFSLYEQWRLRELVDVMLVGSSNDSAQAIAASVAPFLPAADQEDAFLAAMNTKALELGMTDTLFLTPTGLDINDETEPSAYSSARDITHLFEYILKHHPTLIEATRDTVITRTSLAHKIYNIENTNEIVSDIPLLIGSKTGYTDSAGGSLVVAFDVGLGHPIIITVLGSTPEGRFTDMQALINATVRYANRDA